MMGSRSLWMLLLVVLLALAACSPSQAQTRLATSYYYTTGANTVVFSPWVNGTYSSLTRADDTTVNTTIGFAFSFYGVAYSNVVISSNGNLQFATANTVYNPPAMPIDNSAYLPVIGYFFTDLNPNAVSVGGVVQYRLEGTSPNRQFVVRLDGVPLLGNAANVTAEVALYETSNEIEMRYFSVPVTTNGVVIGVERGGGVRPDLSYDYTVYWNDAIFTATQAAALSGQKVHWFYNATIPNFLPATYTLTTTRDSTPIQPLQGTSFFIPAQDDFISTVQIGFPFTFYDRTYNLINVSSNGEIQFATGGLSTTTPSMPMDTINRAPLIAFLSTNLYPNCDDCRLYSTYGVFPNRVFTLRHLNVPYYASRTSTIPAKVTVDVILYESNFDIVIRYYTIDSTTQAATIGIQGSPAPRSDFTYDYTVYYNNIVLNTVNAGALSNSTFRFHADGLVRNATVPDSAYSYTLDVQTLTTARTAYANNFSIPGGDDVLATVPIGFTFNYFGSLEFSQLTVSSNGNIQFLTASTAYISTSLPTGNTAYVPFIPFFWTDLNSNPGDGILSGNMSYVTIGDSPNRQFILRFTDIPFISDRTNASAPRLNADIILYESRMIEMRYYSVPPTGTRQVTIGLESSTKYQNNTNRFVSFWNYQPISASDVNSIQGKSLMFTAVATEYVPPVPLPFSYNVTQTIGAPTQIPFTNISYIPGADEGLHTIDIGFYFTFYGTAFRYVNIGSNGEFHLNRFQGSRTSTTFPLGSANLLPMMAFFFVDLKPTTSLMRSYQSFGSYPNSYFVMRWTNVPYYSCTSAMVSFDVILYQNTSTVEVRYYRVDTCTSANLVIGAQGNAVMRSDYSYDYAAIVNFKPVTATLASQLVNTVVKFIPRTIPTPPSPLTPLITTTRYTYSFVPMTEPRLRLFNMVPMTASDDGVYPASLGFNFVFFDEVYQTVNVGGNGNLQFKTKSSSTSPSSTPSSNNALNPFIACLWGDLYSLNAGAVKAYGVTGSPGQRKFVVRYDNIPWYGDRTKLQSVDCILFEEDNHLEFQYYQIQAYTNNVGIGIQYNSSEYLLLNNAERLDNNGHGAILQGNKIVITPTFQTPAVPTDRYQYTMAKIVAPASGSLSGTVTNLLAGDDNNTPFIEFGFTFPYFGIYYSYCSVNSNGNIQFVTNNNFPNANPLPVGDITSPAIFFGWTNLYANANSVVQYAKNTTAKTFSVRFQNVPYYSAAAIANDVNAPAMSVDVILYGATGNIEFRYYRLDQTSVPMQIGIESQVHADLSSEYYSYLNSLPINSSVSSDLVGNAVLFTYLNTSSVYVAREDIRQVQPTPFSQGTYQTTYLTGVREWSNDNMTSLTYVGLTTSISVNIGFSFQFYSTQYTSLYIDNRGILAFGVQPTGNPQMLPNPLNGTTQYISFAGLNFLNDVGTIAYATSNGTVGNRYFIVRFDRQYQTQFWQKEGALIADILLFESDYRIEIRYYYATEIYNPYYVGVVGSSTDYSYFVNGAWLTPYIAAAMQFSTVIFSRSPFVIPNPPMASSYSSAIDTNVPATPPALNNSIALPPSNDNIDTVRLDFGFTFFGQTYWALNISANGDIQFQTAVVDFDPQPFPHGSVALAPLIAFFYTDLYPNVANSRVYATSGTTPNRVFTLRLTNVLYNTEKDDSSRSVTLDLNLYELDSHIEILYYTIGQSSQNVLVGIEGPGFLRSDYSFDYVAVKNVVPIDANLVSDLQGKRVTFTSNTPIATAPYVPPVYYIANVVNGNSAPTLSEPHVLNPSGTADDVVYSNITIGFTFNFYGVDYTTVAISSNGNIQFRPIGSNARIANKLPQNHVTEMPFIAAYLTDLYPTTGTLKYQMIGSQPNRKFVVRYDGVDRCCSAAGGLFRFDIILTETSNTIQIMYYSLGPSATATILIGTQATQQARADGSYDYTAYWNADPDTDIMRSTLVGNTLEFTRNTGGSLNPPLPVSYSVTRSTSIPNYAPLVNASYILGSDEGVDPIPIGFAFPFYDTAYSSVYVGSNGNLQFATSTANRWPLPLPYADPAMLPLFAFFFTDLNPYNNTMKSYSTTGSSPTRVLTIRFENVPYGLCRTAFVTIDVKLYEVDTRIEVIYYQVSQCSRQNVIIGVQKDDARRSDYTYDYLTFFNQAAINSANVNQLNSAMLTFSRTGAIPHPPQLNLFATGTYRVSQRQVAAPIALSSPSFLATGSALRTVSLGFNFVFYGIPYNQVILTSNGLVRFAGATSVTQPSAMPDGNGPQIPFIAFAFSYQFYYTSIGVDRYYQTIGTSGSRKFILRFDNVQYYLTSANSMSADLILYEADGRIEMNYYSLMNTGTYPMLIGIQGMNSTSGYDYGFALNSVIVDTSIASLLAGTSIVFENVNPIVPVNPRAVTYSYTVLQSLPTRETLTSPGVIGLGDDAVTGPISLGFQFSFYDIGYDSIFVSTNGNIQFSSQFTGTVSGPMPLQSRTQVPMIAFAFTDLNVNASQATYKMMGSSPNRYFIVRFQNVPFSHTYTGQQSVDVDCVLFESDSHIEMRYYGLGTSLDPMTIGLESQLYSDGNTFTVTYNNGIPITSAVASVLNGKGLSFSITSQSAYVDGPIRAATPTPYYQGTYNASIITSPALETLSNPTTLSCCTYNPTIAFGFSFIFMGTSYDFATLDTYGRISFSTSQAVANPQVMPIGNTNVAPFISFAWSNLYRFYTGATYQYATVGSSAPNRYFILRFSNVPYLYSPYDRAVSVDVVLFENDGHIELRYYRLDSISEQGLLIGIQGALGGTTYDYAVVMNDALVTPSLSRGLQNSTVVFRAVSGSAVVVPPVQQIVTYALTSMATPTLDVFTNPSNITFNDDSTVNIPFGFSFKFFQNFYTSGNMSSNGNMQFRTSSTAYIPNALPDGNPLLEPLLAAFWTDLAPNYAEFPAQYQTFGSSPNKYIVIRYKNIPYCCSSTSPKVNFDLVLFETSNRIEIRFGNVDAQTSSRNVLVGVDDAATTTAGMPDFAVYINALSLDEPVAALLRNRTVVITFASAPASSSSSTGGSVVPSSSSSSSVGGSSSSSSSAAVPSSSSSSSSAQVINVGCPSFTPPAGSESVAVLLDRDISNLDSSFGSDFSSFMNSLFVPGNVPNVFRCGQITAGDNRASNVIQPTPQQSLVRMHVVPTSGVDQSAVLGQFQDAVASNSLRASILQRFSIPMVDAAVLTPCPDGSYVAQGQACPNSDSGSGSSKLDGGAVAGIVIGVIVGVAALAVVIFLLVKRSKTNSYSRSVENKTEAGKAYSSDEQSELGETGGAHDMDEVELANVRDDDYAHEHEYSHNDNEMKTNDEHVDGEHDETGNLV